ncbi:response regulator [Conexibacter sp. W3-3-2]|uniref:ANTAR domain-containing response regulator n=1 Tax=Conexibacter sp. W3-3-2 TaxID=2675227 RepID=UPI0013282CD7|nr:response regulator [Conexibacter sp. W3-3-2]MTD45115.1 response regulator [Conexibacter sp. W3-3-2]
MRILVAEDDPVIALGLGARLAALGHEVIGPAADGVQAVELAQEQEPDLYLFDVHMPHLDGLGAAQRLTEMGLRRPVVIITGVPAPDLLERCVAHGVNAYLVKPVDDRQLEASILLAASRHAELVALEDEVSTARHALEDRKVVEHAKAILMEALGLPEPDAFRRLQQTARKRNAKLVDVARDVVAREDLLRPT